jgi:hypothetical protein
LQGALGEFGWWLQDVALELGEGGPGSATMRSELELAVVGGIALLDESRVWSSSCSSAS